MPDLKIEYMNIEELIPNVNNPRKNDRAVDKVAGSISEFGFKNPIIIDKDNVIVAGHTRLLSARKLELKEVPVIRAGDLTDAQIKAFRIADNKTSEFAEWDEELLSIELEALKELDFNLDETGFDMEDIDKMLGSKEVEEDDFEVKLPDEPKAKLGDIYQLGRHRLMCGDSTGEDVDTLMDGNKADMLFTDPPYLMGFTGNVHADGEKSFNSKHGEILNDKMSREDGDAFIHDIIKSIKVNVVGAYYICFYRLGLEYVFRGLDKEDLKYRALIIWDKGNHTLSNSDYMSKYEPIVYGWIDEHNFYGEKGSFDIWEIPRTAKNDLHPTMKPIPLVAKAINDSSKKGNIVLDLFGGSGSTLIACEQTGRECYTMELDPKYVDVIVNRYINLKESSEDVFLIRDGEKISYKEVEKNE